MSTTENPRTHIQSIAFIGNTMNVTLSNHHTLTIPLAQFPRLLQASDTQRSHYDIGPYGIHWAELDEDLSLDGMLRYCSESRSPASERQRDAPGTSY